MKSIAQLFLVFLLMVSSFFFYYKFFSISENKNISKNIIKNEKSNIINKNNKIRNLKYEISLSNENKYIITSETSEIEEFNNYELIKMNNVKAIIKDKNHSFLIINSFNADFNSLSYNTTFSKNVSIEYMNNKIFSDRLNLDFKNNIIEIYDNITAESDYGTMSSDKILIDLISKKIDISMNDTNRDIKLTKY